jgi:hypothetical protein
MALTNKQSLAVVIRCIFDISERIVGPTETLASGGITTAGRVQALKNLIVASPTSGVPRFDHRLSPIALGSMAPGDTVQAVATTVRQNAVPAVPMLVTGAKLNFKALKPAKR